MRVRRQRSCQTAGSPIPRPAPFRSFRLQVERLALIGMGWLKVLSKRGYSVSETCLISDFMAEVERVMAEVSSQELVECCAIRLKRHSRPVQCLGSGVRCLG